MDVLSRWLARDDTLPWTIDGATLDPVHKTRREEFCWVKNQLAGRQPSVVLDAGSGFAVGAHMLPYILAANGWGVLAIDSNPETLKMPPNRAVLRICGDIRSLPWCADNSVPVWICVSVLEHLAPDDIDATLREAYRMLTPGGVALVTADHAPPSGLRDALKQYGFLVGAADDTPPAAPLDPPVGVIAAVKPAP